MGAIKRVAVVGWEGNAISSESHTVSFFDWDSQRSAVNLKDYDIWVLLPETLPETVQEHSIWGFLAVDYVQDALLHRTRIYVVGDPRKKVKADGYALDFLHWLGLQINWDSVKSTAERYIAELVDRYHVGDYLSRQKEWAYALDSAMDYGDLMGGSILGRSQTQRFKYQLTASGLYLNRYNRQIGFVVQLSSCRNNAVGSYNANWQVERQFGSVVVLPPNSNDLADYLDNFLNTVLGVTLQEKPPSWIEDLRAPGQNKIDILLSNLRNEQTSLDKQISEAIELRESTRKPLQLLFQSGAALEESVLTIMEQMGAKIRRPVEANLEDGWITVDVKGKVLEGVLEIKSTKKAQFDTYGLKQLLEWVNRGIESDSKKYKPIFVGNSSIQLETALRENPFPDSWVKRAELGEIAAITTAVLFDAFQRFTENALDIDDFWTGLFQTSGIYILASKVQPGDK